MPMDMTAGEASLRARAGVCAQDLSRQLFSSRNEVVTVTRRNRGAGAHRPAVVLQVLDEAAEHGGVRVQLDLAGTVKQQVVVLAVSLRAVNIMSIGLLDP